MTRIAAGLDAFQGRRENKHQEERWFFHQISEATLGIDAVRYSSILPEGSIIKEVQIHAHADSDFGSIRVSVQVFVSTDTNLSIAQIERSENIINFTSNDQPGEWYAGTGSRDEAYELEKKVIGANQRIGIRIQATVTFAADIRVGVRFKLP